MLIIINYKKITHKNNYNTFILKQNKKFKKINE